jgi:KaiC/GvpD/RAD55 family RecA-like ATPase
MTRHRPGREVMRMVNRIPTYIEGFDEQLEGGIPKGAIVLLSGSTGTMKSSLAFSILYNNALKGKKCLYMSLEQSEKSVMKQMTKMGFDMSKVQSNMMLLDVGAMMLDEVGAQENWTASVLKTIQQVKEAEGCELLAMDSLNAYAMLSGPQFNRRTLFKFFEWLRKIGMTALIITETLDLFGTGAFKRLVEQGSGSQGEYFLADGIISMKMHELNEVEIQRRVRVLKMRATNHSTSVFKLDFKDGKFKAAWALE